MPKASKSIDTLAQLQAALAALTPQQKAAFLKTLRKPSIPDSPALARHLTTLTPAQRQAVLDALAANLPPALPSKDPFAIEQLTKADLQATRGK